MILTRRIFSKKEEEEGLSRSERRELRTIKTGKSAGNVLAGMGGLLLGYSAFNKGLENTDFGKRNPKVLRPDLRKDALLAGSGLAAGGLLLRGASEYYDRKRKKKLEEKKNKGK